MIDIHLIEQTNMHQFQVEMGNMFRQRARIFRDRLKWDVQVDSEGREVDRYDSLNPTYIVALDRNDDTLLGSLRLMSTAGPTLINDVFADTIPNEVAFESPRIWECSRLCVEEDLLRRRSGRLNATNLAAHLLFAIGEVAVRSGIETIVGNFAPGMLRVYKRAGCKVDVLGKSNAYSVPVYMGAFEVSEEILGGMRSKLGFGQSVFAPARHKTWERQAMVA